LHARLQTDNNKNNIKGKKRKTNVHTSAFHVGSLFFGISVLAAAVCQVNN